jgi:hypothetical protein
MSKRQFHSFSTSITHKNKAFVKLGKIRGVICWCRNVECRDTIQSITEIFNVKSIIKSIDISTTLLFDIKKCKINNCIVSTYRLVYFSTLSNQQSLIKVCRNVYCRILMNEYDKIRHIDIRHILINDFTFKLYIV